MHHSLAQRPLHFSFHSLFVNTGEQGHAAVSSSRRKEACHRYYRLGVVWYAPAFVKKKEKRERERERVSSFFFPPPISGVDLKKASKVFANKFACGSSVSKTPAGAQEIVIQGDFVDDLEEFIPETWGNVGSSFLLSSLSFIYLSFWTTLLQISEDNIDILEEKKK